MRGLRQTTVSRAPTIRGRDMRKRTPIKVGINDATHAANQGAWPIGRAVITPGWAKKYRIV